MKNKKIVFISIISCIIIMIFGVTTAYFAQGDGEKLTDITSSQVSLKYTDRTNLMLNNLIPVSNENVKLFATKNTLNEQTDNTGICKYTEEYNACSLYEFTISNLMNVSQEIKVSMTTLLNEYGNLHYMLYEGTQESLINDNLVEGPSPIVGTTIINFKKLNTTLKANTSKTYTLVLYIKDIGVDQTEQDAGKRFGATMNVHSVTTGTYLRNDFGESAITVDLTDGLTPIVYNEQDKKWEIVDTSTDWYDYSNQKWANAAILKDGVSTQATTKLDLENDVYAMYVYIPRYSYTIKQVNGVPVGSYVDGINALTPTQTTPGAIDIKFVTKDTKDLGTAQYTGELPDQYRTHPAFTFGNDELNGIWVGKFETSTEKTSECYLAGSGWTDKCNNLDQNPRILPNVMSLRNQNVYNQYMTARKFTEDTIYGLDKTKADSHMMKNSEWGAVAYLTQSIFGKYGNANYSGANKEIYQNKSEDYITGMSNGTPGTDNYNEQLEYDVSETRKKIEYKKVEETGTNVELELNNEMNWEVIPGGFKATLGEIGEDDEPETALSYTFTLPEVGYLDFEWSAITSYLEVSALGIAIYSGPSGGSSGSGSGSGSRSYDEYYIGGMSRGTDEETLKYDKMHIELDPGDYEIRFMFVDYSYEYYQIFPDMPKTTNAGYIKNISVNYGAEYTETEVETEENGVGASTTGNIYGVYDVSGGANEQVMAYAYNDNLEFGGYADRDGNTYNSSGFTNDTKPEDKYFDKYISMDRLTACNGGPCYGIGYGETPWWYEDYSSEWDSRFPDNYFPWGYRGGDGAGGSGEGAFYGDSDIGSGNYSSEAFRSVLVMTGA